MTRAEWRRAERQKKKQNAATYNFTEGQLKAQVDRYVSDKIDSIREETISDSISTAMTLMLVLPMEVLMDYYWQKSYAKRIPEFTGRVLEYYEKWQNGKLDMDKMKADLWEYGGVRLEVEGNENL